MITNVNYACHIHNIEDILNCFFNEDMRWKKHLDQNSKLNFHSSNLFLLLSPIHSLCLCSLPICFALEMSCFDVLYELSNLMMVLSFPVIIVPDWKQSAHMHVDVHINMLQKIMARERERKVIAKMRRNDILKLLGKEKVCHEIGKTVFTAYYVIFLARFYWII